MDPERRINYEIAHEMTEEDIKREAESERRRVEYQQELARYRSFTQPVSLYDAQVDGYEVRPEVWPKILVQISGLVRVATWSPAFGVYRYGQYQSECISVPSIRFWYPFPEPIERDEKR